jgi:hypothetical protein
MSFTVALITNPLGANTGPFYAYSDVDGYHAVLGIITQYELSSGTTLIVPDGTTTVFLLSVGACGTEIYIPIANLPSPTTSPTPTPTATPSVTVSLTPTVTPTRSIMTSRPLFPSPSPTPPAGIPDEGTEVPLPNPGGGCLVYNTSITMADGTTKPVQDVRVGDSVLSVSSKDNLFETGKFEKNIATVVGTYSILTHNVISINNGLLVTSDSHMNIIKRDNVWSLKTSKELITGDIIIDIDGNEIEITSVDSLSESQLVYNISVNKENLYFANNTLTHNKPSPGQGGSSYICCSTSFNGTCSWQYISTIGTTCTGLGLYNCADTSC